MSGTTSGIGASLRSAASADRNLISYFVGQALGAPADAWIRSDIQHCGLTEITIKRTRGSLLLRHNDVGHLPPELRTFV